MKLRELEKRIRGVKKGLIDHRILDLQDRIGRSSSALARAIRRRSFATYSGLGMHGEFGNQLFQIAVVLGYAAKYGVRPIFPRWLCNGSQIEYGRLYPHFDYRESIHSLLLYEQRHFAYRELPFRLNINLKGNFQSEKYFPTLRPDLIRVFGEPGEITPQVNAYCADHQLDAFDALHMRFYVRPHDIMPAFPTVLDEAYYLKSLQALPSSGTPLVIVSNAVELATEFARKHVRNRPCIVASNANHLVDFYLIGRARNIIISNSTFSWWAAYLSVSAQRVFAPTHRRWFTDQFQSRPSIDCADIIPDRFTQIEF